MPYTLNDFRKEVAREVLDELTPEERLRGLPAEELANRLTPEQRLAGLPAEQRLAGLSHEQRLAGLTPEQIEGYLRGLAKNPPGAQGGKRKPKR